MSSRPPSKMVLVVEDDPSVSDLVAKALQKAGCEVRQAANGMVAAQMLGGFKRLPDLLVCDVMMPGLDGFSLAAFMKRRVELRAIPIIFLTARTDAKDIVRGIKVGARHYIQKPFELKDLLDKVKRCLR